MAERAGIEALAVHFTAGVAAGALLMRLPADPVFLSSGLLLVLASLVVIVLKTERGGLLFPAFVLLGAFCALTDAFPGADTTIFLERWTSAWAERLRAFIDGIPFPSAGTAPLLKALLTGDRSGLSADTVRVFRESGGAHLLALSGLHIGILYLLLTRLLWPLGNSPRARRLRYALIVLAAGLFTLMTGASPSIVRAFLFIFLNETARIACRPRDPLRILSTALLIQLVLVSERRPLRSRPENLGSGRPVHLLPGVHRPPRLVPVPLVPHLLPPHEPHRPALRHPPDGLTLVLRGIHCCPGFLVRATDWLCQALVWILQVISSM